MKVVRDPAFEAYAEGLRRDGATRLKSIRDRQLVPGGRAHVRLFERVGGGRPHPRMHIVVPPARDPAGSRTWVRPPEAMPSTTAEIDAWAREQLQRQRTALAGADLDRASAPKGSELYWQHSIRVQRTASFFEQLRGVVEGWSLVGPDADEATAALRVLEDEAFATTMIFDDADTGTYHSFGHDAPFVHYLEAMLESLPAEGSEAMALLSEASAASVRRQREQARAHLDHIMRHKYAYEVVKETDIERTVGGFLIDRVSRNIVSEVSAGDTLAPRYELLRVDPGATHDAAGSWVYRDAAGGIRLQDGTPIDVDADAVRAAPVDPARLTFRRAVGDPRLREGVRLDWDGNGRVQPGRIEWVSWAGHCDVKAVLEQLGITLTESPAPSVEEYRSDTGQTQVYGRDLLLEMLVSIIEFGSVYRRLDGTGRQYKGLHLFGGSRNDARPDRIQWAGETEGRGFRWPLQGRADAFVVTSITWPDGVDADMHIAFFRRIPDVRSTTFEPNPRYLGTVEGDYNIIDVTGAKLSLTVSADEVDPGTGFIRPRREASVLDLSPGAVGPHEGMFFLGTHVDDAAKRRVFRVYWDPASSAVVAKLFQYVKEGERWVAQARSGEDVRLPMASPTQVTLSREMKRDNPAQYQTLLDVALRQGQHICADTDKDAAVWNGVVTRLKVEKLAHNAAAKTEHWQVDIKARFGSARLSYLVRRNAKGEPIEYCPAVDDRSEDDWPDFLWHDVPDVGSKGFSEGAWVVNETMLDRGVVTVSHDDSVGGGVYVHDDHIKNVFELLYCGLGGVRHTIVHDNKRYAFADRPSWEAAVAELDARRSAVRFATL
ncbi:MAG: hypothetical protein ACE37F_23195 [Nannocystaceae bacterium]|nr:hypothetical protein [bacterium]